MSGDVGELHCRAQARFRCDGDRIDLSGWRRIATVPRITEAQHDISIASDDFIQAAPVSTESCGCVWARRRVICCLIKIVRCTALLRPKVAARVIEDQ